MTPPRDWDPGDAREGVDPILDRLALARPTLEPGLASPGTPGAVAMLERIVAGPPRPARNAPARRRFLALALAVPGVAVVALVALAVRAVIGPAPTRGQAPVAAEVLRVATASSSALGSSGATQIAFDFDRGSPAEERGTASGVFAGGDFDLLWRFVVPTPGLQVEYRLVAGQGYLYTPGPDAKVRWYHLADAGQGPGAGAALPDPRTVLAQVTPAAGFRLVETIRTSGGPVRHLRAATPAAGPPPRSFTNGSAGMATVVTGLDLWVDSHDVISRMDLAWTSLPSSPDPAAGADPAAGPAPCGTRVSTRVGQLLEAAGCPPGQGTTSSVSIQFSDLGSPVSIGVPAGAMEQPR